MLTALEDGVKGEVWFSLVDKVYNPKNLWSAWAKSAANQGAPGVDGITIERYQKDAESNRAGVAAELRNGRYRPKAIRRTYIPKADGKRRRLGIPTVEDRIVQGAVLAPLLSNIYLNPLDHLMEQRGYEMGRYADDFVLLCQTRPQAQAALELVREWTAQAGLTLHAEKTRIADTQAEACEFLGYRFDQGRKWPRDKSKQKLREQLKPWLKRTNGVSLKVIIARINPSLQGWFGYFKHADRRGLYDVDRWVRTRLRSILRKRHGHKGKGRGADHQRWPNHYFADLGLFSLEQAHKLACQSMQMAH